MAKKRRRRTKLLTKAINLGVMLLAFSPAIKWLMESRSGEDIANAYLGGMLKGKFNKDLALQAYGPMVGAIILKKAISMVRKTARV